MDSTDGPPHFPNAQDISPQQCFTTDVSRVRIDSPSLKISQQTPPPPRRARSYLRLRECRAMTDDPPSASCTNLSIPTTPASTSQSALSMPNPPKRRSLSVSAASASHAELILPTHHSSPKEGVSDPRARRKRLVFYMMAFTIMLAMSSLLDIRRASLRTRTAKVHLSLPSAPLSALSDGLSGSTETATTSQNAGENTVDGNPTAGNGAHPVAVAGSKSSTANGGESATEGSATDVNLSDQELKDDVDQLLAHVAEEEGNAGASNTTSAGAVASTDKETEGRSSLFASSLLGVVGGKGENGENGVKAVNFTNVDSETKLNSEEHFTGAHKRMEVLLADEGLKRFVDENDLRTLQALALQATRGNCEQKIGAEGSLFKTDAEIALNVDIEKTDPLWGAWCLFAGSYKTDAMRDYVTKQRVVEDKLFAAKAADDANVTAVVTPFDPNAASLDDVLTPEQQSALRGKMDTIASHLHEADIRYLAALSLQATFGDCGPYGKEAQTITSEGGTAVELRKLREPLLDQTVVRREGAQWGAWCVLQGKKRTSAAADLSHRVDLLIDQWTKSQSAVPENEQSNFAGEVDEKPEGASMNTTESDHILAEEDAQTRVGD